MQFKHVKQLLAGVGQYAFAEKIRFSKTGLLFFIKDRVAACRTSSLERLPAHFYLQIVLCTSFMEFTFIIFSHFLVTLLLHLPVSASAWDSDFRFSSIALSLLCLF